VAQEAEIHLIWAKLDELGRSVLEVARQAAEFAILFAYNWTVTALAVAKPEEIDSYDKYMKPRCDSSEKAALSAGSAKEAFEIATQFQNDCIAYLKSRK